MFKFNRTDRNALTAIVILFFVIVILNIMKKTSAYQPKPIVIEIVNDQSIFDLENRMECVPGSGKEDSPYTKSLTPGGLCGAQKLVDEHASYTIVDGIGGSLI
tara:strand:- start:2331 stop:2639 length:309 start_codon:yes stop_codon:yes gene_type:complete